jgi:hypothetical protein
VRQLNADDEAIVAPVSFDVRAHLLVTECRQGVDRVCGDEQLFG